MAKIDPRGKPEAEPPREAQHEPAILAVDALTILHARIDTARAVEPTDLELHCRDCFHKGRDAALAVVDGRRS